MGRSGQTKGPWGRGEELLAAVLCLLPTSLDVKETNLVLRFGASEIIQRFISLLHRENKPRLCIQESPGDTTSPTHPAPSS